MQSLTFTGSLVLGEECPVCQHTPVNAEDCKPNKNLRTTIKAYIQTEQSKRQKAQREKEAKEGKSAAATPVAVAETSAPAVEQVSEASGDVANGEPVAPETSALERANSAQVEVDIDLDVGAAA